ncbi:MAG: PIN domain nuclease [Propionibacteriaceae bacterium]|nr:PIN domain nuclease [Propionibacteriaceae bacterium]
MTTELPAVNVLLALHVAEHPAHESVSRWFTTAESVVTTPVSEMGLVRLLLNEKVMRRQITGPEALAALAQFRSLDNTEFWADATSLASPTISVRQLIGHAQVTDMHPARHVLARNSVFQHAPSVLRHKFAIIL